MISFIFNPVVFFSILLGLFVISMFIAFNVLREGKKETVAKIELEKNVGNLGQEIEKLKKELSLKEELYQGLKGQYDELERDLETLMTQSPSAESTQTKKIEKPTLKPSVADLLRSLDKTEKT